MSTAKIMIVEDKAILAEEYRLSLARLGYSVTSIVASGEESIEMAERDEPDVILMDIRLRDKMDGIEAAAQIYTNLEIPVVFVSAYSDRELIDRAKHVGSYGYLIKPFSERELHPTLEMVIYKARAEKEKKRLEVHLQQARKMEAIATLAGGVAHQFNNQLSVVSGYLELLAMDVQYNTKVAPYLTHLNTSSRKMTQLTKQLLAYARGGKIHSITVPFTDFVSATLPTIQQLIDSSIQVNTDLSNDPLNVTIDQTQMQMVLAAIFNNSSEAIKGNGCIQIVCRKIVHTEQFVEKLVKLHPGNYALLTITDDGEGMDEETTKRIFEPFFTTKFDGRGLGMAAAYGIIKNHNGYITVNSKLGQGTTVSIYLPIVKIPTIEEAE